jgi:polysaccharide pyruvyl transferase WcaK-like protein
MKWAAQQAHRRSYRDADSRDFMVRLGVDDRASEVLPDLAFLLPRRLAPTRDGGGRLVIGVGVMNYRGWQASDEGFRAYIDLHQRLIEWIEDKGYGVRVVIGQTPADLVAVRELEERLGKSLLTPADKNMETIHQAMDAVAETDLVVASRYHVQIAALKMRRPLISLGYAPKNDSLLEDVGLGDFIHDVEKTDFEKLTRQIDLMAQDRAHYAAIVDENVTRMEKRLEEALLELEIVI